MAMEIPGESTRAAKRQSESGLRELDAPRVRRPFLSRHVRGSLHKRACERNDPRAPDLMPNVCSQAAAAWVCCSFSVSAAILHDTYDQFASYTKNTKIGNARRCL